MRPWLDVLAGLERSADAYERRYLAGDDIAPPPPVAIPDDLGPLPAELEEHARRVLVKLRTAESKLARVPRPDASPRRARFAGGTSQAGTFAREM